MGSAALKGLLLDTHVWFWFPVDPPGFLIEAAGPGYSRRSRVGIRVAGRPAGLAIPRPAGLVKRL